MRTVAATVAANSYIATCRGHFCYSNTKHAVHKERQTLPSPLHTLEAKQGLVEAYDQTSAYNCSVPPGDLHISTY